MGKRAAATPPVTDARQATLFDKVLGPGKVGSGSYGCVFKARVKHASEDREFMEVALKLFRVFRPSSASRETKPVDACLQASVESKGTFDVTHLPGMSCMLGGSVSRNSIPYLVFEYYPANNLHQFLHNSVPDWGVRRKLLESVLRAACSLKGELMVHGDIHSGNLLVKCNNTLPAVYSLVVTDFGLARTVNRTTLYKSARRTTGSHWVAEKRTQRMKVMSYLSTTF